jgi:hypothetical protein
VKGLTRRPVASTSGRCADRKRRAAARRTSRRTYRPVKEKADDAIDAVRDTLADAAEKLHPSEKE